ncbi:MAG: YjbF family lipoprotein [Pseudomonadota bacterium]
MSAARIHRLWLGLLAGLAILAGCGGGDSGEAPLELELIRAGQRTIAQGRGAATPPSQLTRALLDKTDKTILEATLERKDLTAYLSLSKGGSDRGITVWRTADNVTLATRNGVLIATRGLGGDVLSSTVQVAGGRPGPATGGEHVQVIRVLDIQQLHLALACDLEDLGPERVIIVERAHATRHLRQRCAGGGGEVINEFWVDDQAGIVWQSRQWAGPHIGYLRFRRLTR